MFGTATSQECVGWWWGGHGLSTSRLVATGEVVVQSHAASNGTWPVNVFVHHEHAPNRPRKTDAIAVTHNRGSGIPQSPLSSSTCRPRCSRPASDAGPPTRCTSGCSTLHDPTGHVPRIHKPPPRPQGATKAHKERRTRGGRHSAPPNASGPNGQVEGNGGGGHTILQQVDGTVMLPEPLLLNVLLDFGVMGDGLRDGGDPLHRQLVFVERIGLPTPTLRDVEAPRQRGMGRTHAPSHTTIPVRTRRRGRPSRHGRGHGLGLSYGPPFRMIGCHISRHVPCGGG